MNVERIFVSRPPREPLMTLSAVVRDWQWRTAPGGGLDARRDAVVDYCRESLSWDEAVERACASRRADGRMHNHQTKVRERDRKEFASRIIGVWGYDWEKFKHWRFHDWWNAINDLKPAGIGPVTVYDVAVRTGAYMGLKPEVLYLHAGTLGGWVALRGRYPRGTTPSWVPRSAWPAPVRSLEADDFEDFLCTYRKVFPQLRSLD